MKALLDSQVILVLSMLIKICMATYSTYCLNKRRKGWQHLGKDLKAIKSFYKKL